MKVAIIHDWLVTNAGAEKVLKLILDIFPKADVFSLVDFLDDKDRNEILNGKFAKTSFIQNLPFAKKHFRNYLPLFPKAIESLDLSNYDLIISSSWAFAKGIRKNKNQLHISYCHTPIRYAWDLYEEYVKDIKQPKKFLVEKSLKYIRKWDIVTLHRVDYFIANSKFVQKRIKNTYKKYSEVIYPPVNIKKFKLCNDKHDFYLTASRLVPYKKTKLIVEAFNEMPDRNLVVIGRGQEYEKIKKIAKSNIRVLGYQPDELMIQYMQKAKAFVFAAYEDFGIVPVEAMACGTPVIAYGCGGITDTVIDGVTGILFEKQDTKSLHNAIDRFTQCTFDPLTISLHAQTFSNERFQDEFKAFVVKALSEFKNDKKGHSQ